MSFTVRKSETGGPGESGYYAATTETGRIVGVDTSNWTVDVVSEFGNKRWFDLQWSNPYLHPFNGEGLYAMPEVGAMVWVHVPSAGRMATPFVLGFKTESDQRLDQETGEPIGGFHAGRQLMNPGDMMMKTRDGSAIILRRGGVVQILANPICQRLYLPIGNLIQDICQSYATRTFAGDLEWIVNRTDQSDAGEVTTALQIRSKLKANDPGHAVVLRQGSHDGDEDLRLTLVVNETGADGSPVVAQMSINKDGDVQWAINNTWTLEAKYAIQLTAQEGNLILEALQKDVDISAGSNVSVTAKKGKMSLSSKGSFTAKGATVTFEGKTISHKGKNQLGGPGGQPIPLGTELVAILTELIEGMVNAGKPHGPANTPPGFPVLLPVAASLLPRLPKILSTQNTVT